MNLLLTNGLAWCPEGDLNPHNPFGSADFKSAASASFAIRAWSDRSLPVLHARQENEFSAGAVTGNTDFTCSKAKESGSSVQDIARWLGDGSPTIP